MKNLLLVLLFVIPVMLYSALPPSINGLEASLIDANGKVVKSGKFNTQGKLTLNGVKDETYKLKVKNTKNNKSITIGEKSTDILGWDKTHKLTRVSISDYQDGDDLILRKKPGRGQGGSVDKPTGKKAYNENKMAVAQNIRSQNNEDDDCDDYQIDITNQGNGKVEIQIICSK